MQKHDQWIQRLPQLLVVLPSLQSYNYNIFPNQALGSQYPTNEHQQVYANQCYLHSDGEMKGRRLLIGSVPCVYQDQSGIS